MIYLALERMDEVGRELVIDKHYRDMTDTIIGLYKRIEDALPIEHKELIGTLDEEMTSQFNIYLEKMYK